MIAFVQLLLSYLEVFCCCNNGHDVICLGSLASCHVFKIIFRHLYDLNILRYMAVYTVSNRIQLWRRATLFKMTINILANNPPSTTCNEETLFLYLQDIHLEILSIVCNLRNEHFKCNCMKYGTTNDK